MYNVLLIFDWYMHGICLYFLNDVTKLSNVPNEWLFHPLSGWIGYVYKHTLWAVLCTFMSYMHGVIRVTSIPSIHVDLRQFLNVLVFKTSHEKGNCWFKQRLLWKMGMIYIFKGWILNMWLKRRARIMAACYMGIITLDSGAGWEGQLVKDKSHTQASFSPVGQH